MRLPSTASSHSDQGPAALAAPHQQVATVAAAPDVGQETLSEASPRSRGSRGSGASLAQLTAESLQKIHHDAFELLRFSQAFPRGSTSHSDHSQGDQASSIATLDSASRNALLAMAKSSDGIAMELRHMTAIAAQAEASEAGKQPMNTGEMLPPPARRSRKHHEPSDAQSGPSESRRRRVNLPRPRSIPQRPKSTVPRPMCRQCHRVETPQWRPGPDGPETLCNVCGLIYAKRQNKVKAAGASTASRRS